MGLIAQFLYYYTRGKRNFILLSLYIQCNFQCIWWNIILIRDNIVWRYIQLFNFIYSSQDDSISFSAATLSLSHFLFLSMLLLKRFSVWIIKWLSTAIDGTWRVLKMEKSCCSNRFRKLVNKSRYNLDIVEYRRGVDCIYIHTYTHTYIYIYIYIYRAYVYRYLFLCWIIG